ncbi:MAG TPA: hypothetical protein VFX48_09560 [Saprospiraceae bacterium]|nr:hypothetical protein [Saprospiraceae bacterium]
MMKKLAFAALLLVACLSGLQAQRGQAVYAELGGPGLLFSFNYDFRFKAKPKGLGARVGLGYFGSPDDGGIVTVPVQANWLLGKNGRYFELGVGGTLVLGTGEVFDEDAGHLIGTMTFGYRRQPEEGGFMWKIAITPILFDGFFLPYFGGVGLGYAF